jgi:hypothetical protein
MEKKTIGGVNVLLFLGRIFAHLATNKISCVTHTKDFYEKRAPKSRDLNEKNLDNRFQTYCQKIASFLKKNYFLL